MHAAVLVSPAAPVGFLQKFQLAVLHAELIGRRIIFLENACRSGPPGPCHRIIRLDTAYRTVSDPHGGIGIRILRSAFGQGLFIHGMRIFLVKRQNIRLPFHPGRPPVQSDDFQVLKEPEKRVGKVFVYRMFFGDEGFKPGLVRQDTAGPQIFRHGIVIALPVRAGKTGIEFFLPWSDDGTVDILVEFADSVAEKVFLHIRYDVVIFSEQILPHCIIVPSAESETPAEIQFGGIWTALIDDGVHPYAVFLEHLALEQVQSGGHSGQGSSSHEGFAEVVYVPLGFFDIGIFPVQHRDDLSPSGLTLRISIYPCLQVPFLSRLAVHHSETADILLFPAVHLLDIAQTEVIV